MLPFDVGAIVPSARDLFQVLATRRKSLAVVALLGPNDSAEEAARLYDLDVVAFAFAEAGPAMRAAARATKSVPSLCLAPIGDRDAALRARAYGADGVCIDASSAPGAWERHSANAQSTHMLPVAVATDAASVAAAQRSGAKALLVRAGTSEAIVALAAGLPRGIVAIGEIAAAAVDVASVRALLGHVDAVVVPAQLHQAPGFAELLSALDP